MPNIRRPLSPYSRDAVVLLGHLIRRARVDRRMTTAEVAERAGLSRALLQRIEQGDPGCAIGSVFEAATIVGVTLFDADQSTLATKLVHQRDVSTLLPRAIRKTKAVLDDAF